MLSPLKRALACTPVGAGLFLIGQSALRIAGTLPGHVDVWLLATLLGGIGATLVGIDHLSHHPTPEHKPVRTDMAILIPYGITVVSVIAGLSIHFS
ncbi:MAG: hypothetical protein ABEH65_13305 [Halobacteriales archaeon]